VTIYDFSQDAAGHDGERRALLEEDITWSEAPLARRRVPRPREADARLRRDPKPQRGDYWLSELTGAPEREEDRWAAEPWASAPERTVAVQDDRWAPAEASMSVSADGRRTVVITGRGAERDYVPTRRRERDLRPHERAGFKPERLALWAFLLTLLLILVAATSSHGAVLTTVVH
jgi:hypothetical protein